MNLPSRRTFLRQTGHGVLGAVAFAAAQDELAAAARTNAVRRPVAVPGLHAYPLLASIAAGEALQLCVSSTVPYNLEICRLGRHVDDPKYDDVLVTWTDQPSRPHPIYPGSYVQVCRPIEGAIGSLTLECWVRCFAINRRQGLLGQFDAAGQSGFGVAVDADGRITFSLPFSRHATWERSTTAGAIVRETWQHVACTWNGVTCRIFVDGAQQGKWTKSGPLTPLAGPLLMGAAMRNGVVDDCFDGDLASPVIYARALSPPEIQARVADRGRTVPSGDDVLGCWPFSEERGELVHDDSGGGRHGRIVNHATWMIGGPAFNADVPRFGDYDPRTDATRGHALRFASDDLYDCQWPVAHQWTVPQQAKSGVYVARFHFDWEGLPRTYHVTFLVRRTAQRAAAPLVVVVASTTWRAYNGTPFAVTPSEQMQEWDTGGLSPDAHGLPAYCLYRTHSAGQGTYQVGLRVPWPAAGPYILYSDTTQYSHLMRADRFTLVWLEEQGYEFDVVGNEDLHRNPGLLADYKACAIVGHNEYWSRPMYDGVERYLAGGGNLLVLSGNTMGWRVSFDDELTVMECRKCDAPGWQVPPTRRGEAWHSQDGARGGSQRECGMPGYRLIGLDILGWNHPSNPNNYGPYVVEAAEHFLFHQPEDAGLLAGDKFGWAGPGRFPMANGHEFDVRPSTFAALQETPAPPGGQLPVDPEGIERLANGIVPWKEGGTALDYFFREITPVNDQGGELIFWRRPDGGEVFNTGAIASGWTLHFDKRLAVVVRNVLHHFGVERKNLQSGTRQKP